MIARKTTAALTLMILALTLTIPSPLGHARPVGTAQATPDFSISFFANPLTVKRGSGTLFEIEIRPENGFTGTVHFTLSASLPKGIVADLSPFDVQVSGTGITFTSFSLDVPKPVATAPTGTFDIHVQATSGSISHSLTAVLTVR
jgi:hypothetical protein